LAPAENDACSTIHAIAVRHLEYKRAHEAFRKALSTSLSSSKSLTGRERRELAAV
jgi:hypothetical protein